MQFWYDHNKPKEHRSKSLLVHLKISQQLWAKELWSLIWFNQFVVVALTFPIEFDLASCNRKKLLLLFLMFNYHSVMQCFSLTWIQLNKSNQWRKWPYLEVIRCHGSMLRILGLHRLSTGKQFPEFPLGKNILLLGLSGVGTGIVWNGMWWWKESWVWS